MYEIIAGSPFKQGREVIGPRVPVNLKTNKIVFEIQGLWYLHMAPVKIVKTRLCMIYTVILLRNVH